MSQTSQNVKNFQLVSLICGGLLVFVAALLYFIGAIYVYSASANLSTIVGAANILAILGVFSFIFYFYCKLGGMSKINWIFMIGLVLGFIGWILMIVNVASAMNNQWALEMVTVLFCVCGALTCFLSFKKYSISSFWAFLLAIIGLVLVFVTYLCAGLVNSNSMVVHGLFGFPLYGPAGIYGILPTITFVILFISLLFYVYVITKTNSIKTIQKVGFIDMLLAIAMYAISGLAISILIMIESADVAEIGKAMLFISLFSQFIFFGGLITVVCPAIFYNKK